MRTLAVIVLLLAVFGASAQCATDCLTQPSVPPCHQHSQNKSCNHVQPVAYTPAICPHVVGTPGPAETAFERFARETPPPESIRSSSSVLRL